MEDKKVAIELLWKALVNLNPRRENTRQIEQFEMGTQNGKQV